MPVVLGRRSLFALTIATAACGTGTDGRVLEVGDDCQVAREAERRGDYRTAREAYASCLARVPGFVDSHVAYQRILELEDGIDAARETYAALVRANPGVVTSFAHARILPRPERTTVLERIAAGHPDFAPTYYELSIDHSERVLGTQSLSAKGREKLYLESFLMRASGPEFVRNFADYAVAQAWIDDARARLAKLAHVDILGTDGGLKMTATPSNAGWMVHFLAPEPTKAMEYRLDGGPWTKLENYFSTPMTTASLRISVRYEDTNGQPIGPFDFTLDPRAELIAFGKGILTKMPTIWGAFGDGSNAGYYYFTTLMVYRCALGRVEYGIDVAVPDREFPLPTCDVEDPMAIPDGATLFLPIDPAVSFVSMRLTFADGEVSEVTRIERKK
jgi:hypothetical protein